MTSISPRGCWKGPWTECGWIIVGDMSEDIDMYVDIRIYSIRIHTHVTSVHVCMYACMLACMHACMYTHI